jgi:hypothetical protein
MQSITKEHAREPLRRLLLGNMTSEPMRLREGIG